MWESSNKQGNGHVVIRNSEPLNAKYVRERERERWQDREGHSCTNIHEDQASRRAFQLVNSNTDIYEMRQPSVGFGIGGSGLI